MLTTMDPFADPPSTPPVSLDPPTEPPSRRGRRWFGAMAAVGLVGVGVGAVAAGQLGSDGPDSAAAIGLPGRTVDDASGDDASGDDASGDDASGDDASGDDTSGDDTSGDDRGEPGEPSEGDDGSAIVDIDGLDEELLREIQDCLGIDALPELDRGWLDGLDEWIGELPEIDIDGHVLDDLPVGPLDAGTHITVFGPDGATIVELGEGDGQVTISRRDGELTVETDGDATATELGDIIGELAEVFEPGDGDVSMPALDELLGELPSPDEIAACLD